MTAWKGRPHEKDRRGTPPKTVLSCMPTDAKPRLDGRLDDPVWQRAKSAPLQSPLMDDEQWPAAVMLSYDAEFLYVAVKCRQAPGVKYDGDGRHAAPRRRPLGPRPRRNLSRPRPRLRHVLPPLDRPPRLDGRRVLGRPELEPPVVRGRRQRRRPLDGRSGHSLGAPHPPRPAPRRHLGPRPPAHRPRRRPSILDHARRRNRRAGRVRVSAV